MENTRFYLLIRRRRTNGQRVQPALLESRRLVQNSDHISIQEQPTAGIILAAGSSTRFGRPKQLLRLKNKYLIEWVLRAALNSRLSRVVLVLGFAHQKIIEALGQKLQRTKLQIEINPHYQKGQSHSLQVGLSAVKDEFPAVMFLLGDQPMVDSDTLNLLLEKFWSADRGIAVPTFHGQRGNPAIFGQKFYKQIMEIKGDIGARQIIETHLQRVLEIEIENPLFFSDVDTPEDFEKIKNSLR